MANDLAAAILAALTLPEVTAVARQAAGQPLLELHDWRVSQLSSGAGNPVSVGLYRLEGEGLAQGQRVPWSAVLKLVQSPSNVGWDEMSSDDDPTHWNYWRRELLLYPSALLDRLPPGFAAPRFFGASEQAGKVALLWLEDVRGEPSDDWPLARYCLAARHLGRFNGAQAGDAPPYPWLSRRRPRQWVAMNAGDPQAAFPWDHPLVLRHFPAPEANPFRAMMLNPAPFLERLERLPSAICHGDTYPTNFFSRSGPDGEVQTVALDWGMAGFEALGDDLGQLVLGAHDRLLAKARLAATRSALRQAGAAARQSAKPGRTTTREAITQLMFEEYLNGLRDSGCAFEREQVWFGFVANAALRVGGFQMFLLEDAIEQGRRPSQVAKAPPEGCFEVVMAREALKILHAE